MIISAIDVRSAYPQLVKQAQDGTSRFVVRVPRDMPLRGKSCGRSRTRHVGQARSTCCVCPVTAVFSADDECEIRPGRMAPGPGWVLLRRMAAVTGVPVRGGVDAQWNYLGWRFEGDTVVAAPDGRLVPVPGWGRLQSDDLRILRQRENP